MMDKEEVIWVVTLVIGFSFLLFTLAWWLQ
jgi:hypothetical protein